MPLCCFAPESAFFALAMVHLVGLAAGGQERAAEGRERAAGLERLGWDMLRKVTAKLCDRRTGGSTGEREGKAENFLNASEAYRRVPGQSCIIIVYCRQINRCLQLNQP